MIFAQNEVRPSNLWQYSRRKDGIELAVWHGNANPLLACHFHREVQITAVLKGCRRFLTSTGAVTAGEGEVVIIPPSLPHQTIGFDAEHTLSLNFYLKPEGISPRRNAIVVRMPRWLRTGLSGDSAQRFDWVRNALMRFDEGSFPAVPEVMISTLAGSEPRIGDIASARGLSREGFIRSFRRSVGMTPHAYRLASRLNHARELLAAGDAPAQAAAEAGFADQSHLGRHFRLTFGVTPGAYRGAVRTRPD
jgi:AraC-like DNA-binding protein